jgi:SAM-dependent methyltransferase
MIYYHTFKDLNIKGIYDHEPHLSSFQFPDLTNKSVLDVGCASGYFSKLFFERGASSVTSVDITTSVIDVIKQKTGYNINIIKKDLYDIDFNNQFDFVFCGSLLMHSFYPMTLLKIVYNALNDGGQFVLSTGGIDGNEPYIRTEPYLGRSRGDVESEVKSANESIWWLSKKSGIDMLNTVGFRNVEYKSSYYLNSTEYGDSIGHNYSSLHHIWHAYKN